MDANGGRVDEKRKRKRTGGGDGPRKDPSDVPRFARQVAAYQALAKAKKKSSPSSWTDRKDSRDGKTKKQLGSTSTANSNADEHSAFFKSTNKYAKRRAYLDGRKKKTKTKTADSSSTSDGPRFEQIRIGDVVQEPPKLLATPKARLKVHPSASPSTGTSTAQVNKTKEEALVSVSWRKRRLKALPASERIALEAERGLMIQKYREIKAAALANRETEKLQEATKKTAKTKSLIKGDEMAE